MWYIIEMIIIGLIAGGLARLILPGKDPMGLVMTAVLGIAGSFLGGTIGQFIWPAEGAGHIRPGGLVLSIIGAVIILWISRVFRHPHHHPA